MDAQLPPGYASRPATLDDAAEIADVVNAETLETYGYFKTSAAVERSGLQMPAFDLARHTLVVVGPDGRIVATTGVFDAAPHVRLYSWSRLHPGHSGKGIRTFLAAWVESRARQSTELAPPGARVVLGREVLTTHSAVLDLLRGRGFQPARYFSVLRIEFDSVPAEPAVPPGIQVGPFGGEATLPDLVRSSMDAFRDHWGHFERPFEDSLREFQAWISTSPYYDRSLWLVASDGDEIVGYAISEAGTAEDPEMGYISELGVRRRWRRRGIGTALLLSSMRAICERGLRRAALDVDSESLTGATRLYERAGFQLHHQTVEMERELRPGQDLTTH